MEISACLLRCACVLVIALGCARAAIETGVPGVPVEARFEVLAERFDYIDANVAVGGQHYRFFFPRSETCRAVLASEEARFRLAGVLGTAETSADSCPALGILSLQAWRDRAGRAARGRTGGSPVPSDRIEYRVIFSDEDLFLARGRFRLASEIGWTGGVDTIAVFPNDAACQGVRERTRGTMEFRRAGSTPFSVPTGSQRCPLLGFTQIVVNR